jgi:hypothetical protein
VESLLIKNSAYSQPDWLKLLERASQKLPYKFISSPNLEMNKSVFIHSSGSIGGLEILLQSNGLKIFPSALPSRKDLRFMRQLIEAANKEKCISIDSQENEVKSTAFTDEKLKAQFEGFVKKALSAEKVVVQGAGRKADITSLLKGDLKVEVLERTLIDLLDKVYKSPELEVFPIDGIDSVIWDGRAIWLPPSVKQLLFNQKEFKGKLCGEISVSDFAAAVPNKIWDLGFGYLLTEAKALSTSDFDAIYVRMGEHFEQKVEKKVYEKLEIEVGKLQEISYVMSKCIFTADSLSNVTENYTTQGISKAQLEVTALAVSSMLEIAAISKGEPIEVMTKKLIAKNKLTKNAALAVINGFVQAASEVDLNKKKINWTKLVLIIGTLAAAIWFFFIKK